ncbi:hypothetical protein MANES_02G098901v8 [Manihot esculenta]|uniref:Uncharacterized protein n=1 Tax=Manihot esculenta TaxID=3983 RepID=A0ACB7I537_MANES|nr:hypothetical protein MANES_02G098901v8 [Manihot esculenta]
MPIWGLSVIAYLENCCMLKGSAMEGLLCMKRWGSGVECNFNMMGGGRVIKRFPTIIFFSYRLCQCRHIAKPRKSIFWTSPPFEVTRTSSNLIDLFWSSQRNLPYTHQIYLEN